MKYVLLALTLPICLASCQTESKAEAAAKQRHAEVAASFWQSNANQPLSRPAPKR